MLKSIDVLCAGIVALGWTVPSLAASPPVALQPHTAVYNIKLLRADPLSGIDGADGRLVVEFDDVCAGYTLSERMVLRLANRGAPTMLTDFRTSSFEAKPRIEMESKTKPGATRSNAASSVYRFTSSTRIAGEIAERYRGAVFPDPETGGLTARYETPLRSDVSLRKGAVVPIQHTRTLIAKARAGATSVSRVMFDGDPDSPMFNTFAAISPMHGDAAPPADGAERLRGIPRWAVSMSYFPLDGREPTPGYQVDFTLYANGVSDEMRMDYGNFALRASLEKIIWRKPDC